MKKTFVLLSKRVVAILLVALSAHVAGAYDFIAEGVAYNFNDDGSTVAVTRLADGEWYEGDVVIPQKVAHGGKYYDVTEIGDNAFDRKSISRNKTEHLLSSVYIPETVTRIGNAAFAYQYQLQAVTIPNSVSEVGNYAFLQCEGLIKAKFSTALASLGVGTFKGCTMLSKVDLSATPLKTLSRASFYQCKNLAKVKLPVGLEVIGDSAFYRCEYLVNIDLPETLRSIEVSAFQCCTRLKSIKIPDSITEIKDEAFSGDDRYVNIPWGSSLVHVDFPKGLTKIGKRAFAYTYLDAVVIPSTVTEIGEGAFTHCDYLKSVFIPNSVKTIGDGAFFFCFNLSSVTLGNGISNIGKNVFAIDGISDFQTSADPIFRYNGSISLTITNDYVACADLWEEEVCYGPNIRSLTLSKDVTKANGKTFNALGDYLSSNVFCYANVPPVVTPASTNTISNIRLHVPEKATSKYFTADHWKNYANIVGDAVEPESITFNEHSLTLNVGDMFYLTSTVLNKDGSSVETTTDKDDSYSYNKAFVAMFSTNKLVANVTENTKSYYQDGVYKKYNIEAKGKGECDIVTFYGNVIDYCHVVVNGEDQPADDDEIAIVLECNEKSLFPNEMVTLHPKLNVNNLPNPTFSVECDNNEVVLVRSMVVNNYIPTVQALALKPGVANITVKCDNYADVVEPAVCKIFVTREISDVNIDGVVNAGDASAIYEVILNSNADERLRSISDLNGDGFVNAGDISILYENILKAE